MNIGKENYKFIILAVGLILVVVFFFAIYNTFKSRKEQKEQEIAQVSREFAGYFMNTSTINYITTENLFLITSDHELSNDEKSAIENSIKESLGDRYSDFTNASGNLNVEYTLEGSVIERPAGIDAVPPALEDEYEENRPKNYGG